MTTRRTQKIDKVPFSEVEPLLLAACEASDADEGQVFKTIGYDPSYARVVRKEGECRRAIKYALMGLLTDLQQPQPAPKCQFDFNDMESMFRLVMEQRRRQDDRGWRCLQAKIAQAMVESVR